MQQFALQSKIDTNKILCYDLNLVVKNNIESIRRRMKAAAARRGYSKDNITLVAVTKGVDIGQIKEAFSCGITDIGENRVQEAIAKYNQLSAPEFSAIKWHMVGHLQRNKVKDAARIFDVIHSVDSIELAEDLNKHLDRTMDIFIQVNVSCEATKFGIEPDKLDDFAKTVTSFKNLRLRGLMTIAPLVTSPQEARPYFKALKILNDRIGCRDLSMGMSGDFEAAIEEGATYVRIGTAIFKE